MVEKFTVCLKIPMSVIVIRSLTARSERRFSNFPSKKIQRERERERERKRERSGRERMKERYWEKEKGSQREIFKVMQQRRKCYGVFENWEKGDNCVVFW